MSIVHNIGLTLIKSVGQVTAKSLLAHFGGSEEVFKASKKQLMQVQGVGEMTATQIRETDALAVAEDQLKFIDKHKIRVLFYTDDDYPQRLRHCFDAPILLYYKGTADLNHPRIISVVGTRMATDYGKRICQQLMETFAPYNILVVSGLAYGVDVAAHKASLSYDIPTIGVLGHGLDRIYPPLHKEVAQKMVRSGGLLTEFPLYTNPDRENFPMRNRIIAGIADATIVVEATVKGGALITADIANSYSRDVFAFPGRINDEYSQGCNFLIKTNRAALVNHPKDVLYYLGWDDKLVKTEKQMELPVNLSKPEQKIVEVLKISPTRIHEIAVSTEISQSKLAIHLLNLEMQGIIVSLPGSLYKLN